MTEILEHLRMYSYIFWVLFGILRVVWLLQYRKVDVVPGMIARHSMGLTSLLVIMGMAAWGSVVKYRLTNTPDERWVTLYTATIVAMATILAWITIKDYILQCRRNGEKRNHDGK